MTITVISIIVFIVFVVIIYVWVVTLRQVGPDPIYVKPSISTYGMACSVSENNCALGLECVNYNKSMPNSGICKKSLGQACSTVIECGSNGKYCTGGVCSETYCGGFNQKACNNDYCVYSLTVNDKGICKGDIGFPCSTSSDCYNNICYNGFCSLTNDAGQSCTLNSDCSTNNCSYGICQNPGVITRQIGSYCTKNSDCSVGACAITDYTNNEVSSFCQPLTSELSFCSSNSSCPDPLICYNGQCTYPRNDDYLNPDSCSLTNSCIVGTCNGLSCQLLNKYNIYGYTNYIPNLVKREEDALAAENDNDPSTNITVPPNVTSGSWTNFGSLPSNFTRGSLSALENKDGNTAFIYAYNDEWYCYYKNKAVKITLSGTYFNNTNSYPITPDIMYMTHISFTPGRMLKVTLHIKSGDIPIERLFIAKISSSFYTDGIVSIKTWIGPHTDEPRGYTTRLNNKDYYYVRQIKWSHVDDRQDTAGQIKVVIVDHNNNLCVAVGSYKVLNCENKGCPEFDFYYKLSNYTNISYAYIFNWMLYNMDEYFYFNNNKIMMSYNDGSEQKTQEINLPSTVDTPNYQQILQWSVFYPFAADISRATIATLATYPDGRVQCWLSVDSVSLFLPGGFDTTSDLVVSYPCDDNYSSILYVVP